MITLCDIFYVVLQVSDHNFSLNLYYKPQEELSSAGEQLNSNRVYDGEYTGPFSIGAFFSLFIIRYG